MKAKRAEMKGHEGLLTSVQKDGMDDDLLEYIHELETKHLQLRNQKQPQGDDSFYHASFEGSNVEGRDAEPPMEDPRSYDDLEKENIDLKEQMIHQVLTLEQYLQVANVWLFENGRDHDALRVPQEVKDRAT